MGGGGLAIVYKVITLTRLVALCLKRFLSSLFYRCQSIPSRGLLKRVVSVIVFVVLNVQLVMGTVHGRRIRRRLRRRLKVQEFIHVTYVDKVCALLAKVTFKFLRAGILVVLVVVIMYAITFIVNNVCAKCHIKCRTGAGMCVINTLLL